MKFVGLVNCSCLVIVFRLRFDVVSNCFVL